MNSRFAVRRPRITRSRPTSDAALAAENDHLKASLADARTALETAEERERARIADDLHDILGHALEVVAFKAELADRVVGADVSRARSEMVEIQRVARSAITDVRSLARCRRPTDLDTQLAATVSLFSSAGVAVSVIGGTRSVSKHARDPLARVLREGVTNVLRHANPTRCLITVEQAPSAASVSIVNDGVDANATTLSQGGSGLAGLARMLFEHDGRLSASRDAPGEFTLRATVNTTAATSCDATPEQIGPAAGFGGLRLVGQR